MYWICDFLDFLKRMKEIANNLNGFPIRRIIRYTGSFNSNSLEDGLDNGRVYEMHTLKNIMESISCPKHLKEFCS